MTNASRHTLVDTMCLNANVNRPCIKQIAGFKTARATLLSGSQINHQRLVVHHRSPRPFPQVSAPFKFHEFHWSRHKLAQYMKESAGHTASLRPSVAEAIIINKHNPRPEIDDMPVDVVAHIVQRAKLRVGSVGKAHGFLALPVPSSNIRMLRKGCPQVGSRARSSHQSLASSQGYRF